MSNKTKNTNISKGKISKQELANKIWESANKLRGNLESYEYKNFILSLIFYKFLSEKQLKLYKMNAFDYEDFKLLNNLREGVQKTEEQQNKVSVYDSVREDSIRDLGFFIDYKDLYQTWRNEDYVRNNDFSASHLQDAIISFENTVNSSKNRGSKPLYEDIFYTFRNEMDKLGNSPNDRTKKLLELMQVVDTIPTNEQDYDVLGFIYEFLISMFASTAGKKAGEFYTPHEVSVLMSEIVANHLKDRQNVKVYDPTSGSGSLLLNISESISKFLDKHDITYYAQELNKATFNLTRMNLVMRDVSLNNINVRCGDTLKKDWPFFVDNDENRYEKREVDAVVSNPPYSLKWDNESANEDERFNGYGIAPKSKADYAFLLHCLYHLEKDGIMTIVLPHGVLFRGGSEKEIRKQLIEKRQIQAIIGLPANIFYGTSISTIIMVLRKDRNEKDANIQFIDASELYEKDGKNNKLRASDIKRIVDAINFKKEVEGFSRLVGINEIIENEYNLNISRYINNFKKEDIVDLYGLMNGGIPTKEVNNLEGLWKISNELKSKILVPKNNDYFNHIKEVNVYDTVFEDEKIKNYLSTFSSLSNILKTKINDVLGDFKNIQKINSNQFEEQLLNFLEEHGNDVINLDKYDLYQIFYDILLKIKEDLFILKNKNNNQDIKLIDLIHEDIEVKKDSKNNIVVDWESKIIPQKIILEKYFSEVYIYREKITNEIDEINSSIESLYESIDENDKDDEIFNEKGFEKKNLIKAANEFKKEKNKIEEESFEAKILEASELFNKKDVLEKNVKEINKNLISDSYSRLMNLDEESLTELLKIKWTSDITQKLIDKGNEIIEKYVSDLEYIIEKYSETLEEVNEEINKNEKELLGMLSELKTEDEYDQKAIDELIKMLGGK